MYANQEKEKATAIPNLKNKGLWFLSNLSRFCVQSLWKHGCCDILWAVIFLLVNVLIRMV